MPMLPWADGVVWLGERGREERGRFVCGSGQVGLRIGGSATDERVEMILWKRAGI